MQQSKIVMPCPPHMAPILRKELEQLGYKIANEGPLEVSINGTYEDCMFLNLHLRTANKVLYQLKSFRCKNPDQLYQQLYQVKWEEHLYEEGYLCVTSYVNNEKILNTQFANVRVKDAIVDRIKDQTGNRPDSGPLRDQMVVFLHWMDEQASIYLDTSGETISKHGYRKIPGKAPMMEALAAATIMESNWKADQAFINPMCGSGTLAIEAALMAANIAPGQFREKFGFHYLKGFDLEAFDQMKKAAKEKETKPKKEIIATDHSRLAIQAAEKNADFAGVKDFITFKKCDFRDTEIPEGEGIVFLNPEYGERLGEETELANLYAQIGDFFKQECKGKTGYIFTGNLKLAKRVGLRTKRRIPFLNAKIECRLLEYELYAGTKKDKN
ncbi:THUMP domain-containing class I SAM-dependent RNA methyltransferase [Marivirga atlantica]|jgi:23S rRNA G2445 N2-methylase RlmL|uniref:Class I SAM-dependent RNA methyltransferase n=1 Tax=Marivirga atlantica TaxID=1548457 RepID=A0A937ADP2_9BACT|nr:class I SAM-dependent RNA methyltransferase [Marivirga atlantica]MBL0764639.1 class I SAM-dependent RNA methyltransferase [Marivirga atlantica]